MDGNPRIWGLPEIRIKEEDDSRVPVEIGKGVLETKLIKTGQRLYLSKRQRDKLALGLDQMTWAWASIAPNHSLISFFPT